MRTADFFIEPAIGTEAPDSLGFSKLLDELPRRPLSDKADVEVALALRAGDGEPVGRPCAGVATSAG
jgi:hypothetical protein